jgi:hypothetical protein
MFVALLPTPDGEPPRLPACRDEAIERIGRDLLLLQDSCHLLRLACQIVDYGAATAEREVDAGLTNERADGSCTRGPNACDVSETLHA